MLAAHRQLASHLTILFGSNDDQESETVAESEKGQEYQAIRVIAKNNAESIYWCMNQRKDNTERFAPPTY